MDNTVSSDDVIAALREQLDNAHYQIAVLSAQVAKVRRMEARASGDPVLPAELLAG